MRYLQLGKTTLTVSEFGFGCIPIIRLSQADAVKVLRHAFERGITYFDTVNAYRDSEEKIGIAFEGMRDRVVIATKSLKRNADGVTEHLENSLRMLRTDYIDLYQFHQIAQEKDWQEVTGASGALEAVMKCSALREPIPRESKGGFTYAILHKNTQTLLRNRPACEKNVRLHSEVVAPSAMRVFFFFCLSILSLIQ